MIKRKDLVDIGDKNYKKRQGELLICRDCGGEGGGTRGDLFMLPLEQTLRCGECSSDNLFIGKKITKIKVIQE